MAHLTRFQATALDYTGEFVARREDLTGSWGVYGSVSGYLYELSKDERQARNGARRMNNMAARVKKVLKETGVAK